MLPHKLQKGAEALSRLKVFEGVPYPYDEKKRMVVPNALKVLRIKNFRKQTILGDLATKVGWNKAEVVDRLEDQRKAKALKFYDLKKAKDQAHAKKAGSAHVAQVNKELAKYGY